MLKIFLDCGYLAPGYNCTYNLVAFYEYCFSRNAMVTKENVPLRETVAAT